VGGKSSGRQIVGWRFAGPSGSRTKGQPPATGDFRHGRFFGDCPRGDALKRSPIVFPIFGIAPQEFPRESGAIEILQDVACIRRPPVRRSWHASLSPSKALQGRFGHHSGEGVVPLVLGDRMRDARRRGYSVRHFGALWRFSSQNSGVIVGAEAKDCGSPPASSSAPARDDCRGRRGRVPVRDRGPGRR
jgi:hypothetical protein